MAAVISVLAMAASCLGWGMACLRLAPIRLSLGERLAWGATLGMGVSGWLLFPAVLAMGAGFPAAAAVCLGGIGLLGLVRRDLTDQDQPAVPQSGIDVITWGLFAAITIIAVFDLAAALVPPVDADSMAYHFALSKRYLAEGRIRFVPQAVEAAIPLLLHMTYMQAMALGGELGLTLWCGLSSWTLPLAVFAAGRRYLPLNWSLALLALVKSMPAVVYGSPAGQIEVRLAALFLVALYLAVHARRENSWRIALVAGLAAGFCAGAKYSGLLMPAVCGLALLGGRKRLPAMAAFGLAALIAGAQWYWWNWLHTGDPLFPMLWGKVPYTGAAQWSDDMARSFSAYLASEVAVAKTIPWLLYYPFKATFDGLPIFESSRTGFGPLPIILFPFAVAGLMGRRDRLTTHELTPVAIICFIAYAVWFLAGSSQRVRHFLPEYVAFLPLLIVAARSALTRFPGSMRPLGVGLAVILMVQLGGQFVFSAVNLHYLLSEESRDSFIRRNLSAYPVVQWVNTHLGPGDRIMLTNRELIYQFDGPVLYLPPSYDGRIRLSRPLDPLDKWRGQLQAEGVTHLLVANLPETLDQPRDSSGTVLETMAAKLIQLGCASVVKKIVTPALLQSRTLRLAAPESEAHLVVALHPGACPATTGHGGTPRPNSPL